MLTLQIKIKVNEKLKGKTPSFQDIHAITTMVVFNENHMPTSTYGVSAFLLLRGRARHQHVSERLPPDVHKVLWQECAKIQEKNANKMVDQQIRLTDKYSLNQNFDYKVGVAVRVISSDKQVKSNKVSGKWARKATVHAVHDNFKFFTLLFMTSGPRGEKAGQLSKQKYSVKFLRLDESWQVHT